MHLLRVKHAEMLQEKQPNSILVKVSWTWISCTRLQQSKNVSITLKFCPVIRWDKTPAGRI